MEKYNCTIVGADTDALIVTNPIQSEWSQDEQDLFIKRLNEIFPDKIRFEHDGYYDAILVLAGKNYVMKKRGDDKLIVKGSALKDQKKEPALKEMIDDIIYAFIYNQKEDIPKIYEYYVAEALNVQDIMRWSQKKTITDPILNCNGAELRLVKNEETGKDKKVYFKKDRATSIRSNEVVLWNAIKNEELLQLGDKFYVFPAILEEKTETKVYKNGNIKVKNTSVYGSLQPKMWTGKNHDVEHLLKRLYNTLDIFDRVLDMNLYKDYSKTKNYKELLDKQT